MSSPSRCFTFPSQLMLDRWPRNSGHRSVPYCRAMDTEDVWRLVAQARADTDGGAPDAVAARMTELLARRQPVEIVAFAQPLWDLLVASYRADLWAAAYVINGGASDDGFDYFRGWLIAEGRDVYDRALADPDSLATHPAIIEAAASGDDPEDPDILSVAWSAHRAATGED